VAFEMVAQYRAEWLLEAGDLARGLSVRDIEDAFKDVTGRLLLSKTTVAEIGGQLCGAEYSRRPPPSSGVGSGGRSGDPGRITRPSRAVI
jgi:hypothetical protein